MSADLYFTGIIFFLLFRQLPFKVSERNSTKICQMLGSKCNLKMHVQNLGYPLPLQIGCPKTTYFRRLRNLTTALIAYISDYLRNETRQSGKYVDNYDGSAILSQNNMNFGPQTASNWTLILPTLRKICIPLHCQVSQTKISKRNSTTLCQTVDGRSRQQFA